MNKLTVRKQLAISFGGLAALLVGVAVISLTNFMHLYEDFENYVTGVRARSEAAHLVREAVDLRAIAARNLVLVTTTADRDAEMKIVTQAHADVTSHLKRLKELAIDQSATQEDRRLVEKIDGIEQLYAPVALAIVDLAVHGRKDEAVAQMNERCRPLLASLIATSTDYSRLTAIVSEKRVADATARFSSARNVLIASSVVAIALAIIAGMFISRRLYKALGAEPTDLCDAVSKVASGDLSQAIEVRPNDTGSVLAAVQRMQRSLSDVVSSVRRDSDAVSTAAGEISAGNSDLSNRTEQQASSLEETASSMEELTSTVRQNADNARQANVLAMAASDMAVKGGAVVEQVVGTMASISEASRKIVDIISVIDGIAFQTNILALNAAVEAARAGEQGRGFAVVASEVRNLAQRSASAAKEIKVLIDNSVERVDLGTRLATDAGGTMSEVVGSVRRVTDVIGEIMSASQEQSEGIEQVNQAIIAMDNVTQQNASLVEQAAAAAESLRDQAGSLVQAMSVFKIRPEDARHEPATATATARKVAAAGRALVIATSSPRARPASATPYHA
jgi:methyl-accepting chemotaxis protein-1 (serine sensor receptor)